VIAGDPPPQGLGEIAAHRLGAVRQDGVGVEPAHLQHRLQHLAVAVELRTVLALGDPPDGAVDVGGARPVQGELPRQDRRPLLGR
jgi:hypothetical protein